MSWPRTAKPTETGFVGSIQVGDRKHAPTSVPPLMLTIGIRPLPQTCSSSQSYGPRFQVSPVVTTHRSDDIVAVGTPFGISARTSVGEIPSIVTRSSSTSCQRRSAGQSGAPSLNTIVAPRAPAPTTVHGPMIQPMSVENSTRSPAWRSAWYAASRAIETRNPPCTWTAPFGFPVVPDVYASR